jgi:hypothetical protein
LQIDPKTELRTLPFASLPTQKNARSTTIPTGYTIAGGKRFHGSIILKSKDGLKAHGEAFPDDEDTLAMTFAVKVAAKQKPKYQNLVYSFPSENDSRWMQ